MTPTPAPKTFRVKSFGCQMNVYDGERMAELLGEQGIAPAPDGTDADLVVLNTCHIREKAVDRAHPHRLLHPYGHYMINNPFWVKVPSERSIWHVIRKQRKWLPSRLLVVPGMNLKVVYLLIFLESL